MPLDSNSTRLEVGVRRVMSELKVLHLSVSEPPYGVHRICDRCGEEIDCTTYYLDNEEDWGSLEAYVIEQDIKEDLIRCTDI